jgi:hypothetical protein
MEIAVSTSPVHIMMARKKNTWYSVRDGNWSDPNTWMSNALDKRVVIMPRPGDDVYINHTVTLDSQNGTVLSYAVNNLYISGRFLFPSGNTMSFSVNGDLQASGSIDMSGGSRGHIISLFGANNLITTFTAGSGTVSYERSGDQFVMDLAYNSLRIYGMGTKYLTANTFLAGNLNVNDFLPGNALLECLGYNLTVNGTSSITGIGASSRTISKSGAGNILFIGSSLINSNPVFSSSITNIEFRGGFTGGGFGGTIIFNCPVSFTTNSQIMSASTVVFNNTVLVSGAVTLTYTGGVVTFNGGLDGDSISSTYNNNSYTNIGFSTTLPMSTGVFNYQNLSVSKLGYTFNGNYTLPYTTYTNLVIYGTGTKSLIDNTIIAGNLNVNDFQLFDAKLDCGNYNLIVNGTTSINGSGNITSDASLFGTNCTMIFIGAFTMNTRNISYGTGVTLEFRGGASLNAFGSLATLNCNINFTTSSQTFSTINTLTFAGNFNISGGITVSVNLGTSITGCGVITGVINGSNSLDIFNNTGFSNYQNPIPPMVTGKLYCNQSPNTFIYGLTGNQDIQIVSDPTPGYKNLVLQGSGTKKLLGNISVKGIYTLTLPATLNSNGFTIFNP